MTAYTRKPRKVDEPPNLPPSKQLDQPKPQPAYVVEQSVLTPEQEIRYLATSVAKDMAPTLAGELLNDAGVSPDSRNVLELADILGAYLRDGTKPSAVIQFPDGELHAQNA